MQDSNQRAIQTNSGHSRHSLFPTGQLVPFVLITFLFFLWGIPNNLNDVLIRQFMKSFAINRVEAGLVQSAFYMGYFLLAMPLFILFMALDRSAENWRLLISQPLFRWLPTGRDRKRRC